VLYQSHDLVHYRREGPRQVADSVWAYQVDPDGQVWLGSGRDVSVYHTDGPDRVTTAGAPVRALHRTGDGTLWIGTEDGGLFRRTPDGEQARLTAGDGLLANRVLSFAEDEETMLIGTAAGLQRWDDGELTKISPPDTTDSLQVVNVRGDVQGTCWAQTPRGVYRCEEGRLRPYRTEGASYDQRPHFLSEGFVQEGAEGHLFVNAGRTLYRDGTPIFETEYAIRGFTQDQEGTLWVGTGSRGLFQLRPSTFTVYGTAEGLPHNTVTTIAERRDSSIWMGTRPGALVDFREGDPAARQLQKAGEPLRPIFALHEDRSGQLWVGGTRLCRMENGQCARPERPGPIPQTLISSIHEDRQGRLWVGTLGRGLYRRSAAGSEGDGEWTQFTPENSKLPSREIRWIHETPTGDLWFAAVEGADGQLARYRDETFAVLPDSLTSSHPSFLYQDTTDTGTPGVLWMGTAEYGLDRIDLRGADSLAEASVTTYRTQEGLHHNTIYQVVGDGRGRLWISTSNGIFWVEKAAMEAVARGDRSRVRPVVYTTRDGLRNVEGNGFGGPGAVRARDGTLWFPNQAGAVTVDPSTVPVEAPPPRMHVEAVRSGDSLLTDAPDSAAHLAKNRRSFSVEYTGIRTSDSDALDFRYRLAGLHDEWINAGSRREAFFTGVPPGTYILEVEGKARNGPWSAEPARLTLTVAPFFYETWWFYGLCVVLLGALAYGGAWYRLYAFQRRQERLETTVEERTRKLRERERQLKRENERLDRFAGVLSHDLRNPLNVAQGRLQLAREQNGTDPEGHLSSAGRALARMDEIIEDMLLLTWSERDIDPDDLQTIQLEEAIRKAWDSVEAPEATCTVESSARLVCHEGRLRRLLENLFRNAVEHGGKATTVRVGTLEGGFYVEDTGPGIPKAKRENVLEGGYSSREEGTGLGLSIVQGIAEAHGWTLSVTESREGGARFEFADGATQAG
ncbi:MAG: two-component regulator propeller domain-containing protein, partial [Salinibacter sp.]